MAALVVVTVSPANGMSDGEGRVGIFPGGATPSMYPANTPFWVGYGFAADVENGTQLDGETTRFELDVDGAPVSMLTDVQSESGVPVRKTDIAEFPAGLPAGWHDFSRTLVRRRPPDPVEPSDDPVRRALSCSRAAWRTRSRSRRNLEGRLRHVRDGAPVNPPEGVHRCSQPRQHSPEPLSPASPSQRRSCWHRRRQRRHRTAARALTAQAARTVPPSGDRNDERLRPNRTDERLRRRRQRPGRSGSAPRGRTALTARPSVWSSRPATRRSRAQPCSPPGERSSGRPAGFCRPSWLPGSSELSAAVPASTSSARPPCASRPRSSGEEIGAALASAWHDKGFTGKGVKVAIVDGGFMGLADRQAAGDLPANVVTQDYCGGELATADDHGTAVAEIVHEMAPDAQLYLICVGGEVDFLAAVGYAKSQGVSVVNQSMGWEGPYRDDGSGPIGAAVADARASGILWVNSAGNEAMNHWSGTYSPVVRRSCSPVGSERRRRQHVRVAERLGDLRLPQVGRVARRGVGLRPRARVVRVQQAARGVGGRAGCGPTAVRGDVPPTDQRKRPDGLLGDPRVPGRVVAAHRPRQLEPAARVPGGGREHRHACLVARRIRGRRPLLAVALARAVQLAGPDDRRPHRSPTSSDTTACPERRTAGSRPVRRRSRERRRPHRRSPALRRSSSRRIRRTRRIRSRPTS